MNGQKPGRRALVTMPMPQKTALIYARVSTARQAADELPIESQIEECRKRCTELGALVERVFVDGGISGGTDQRPAFQEAMLFAQEHRPTMFVCWDYKRFAREYVDAGLYRRTLRKYGVELVFCSGNVDTTTPSGYTFQAVLDVFADAQRLQTSEETKRSLLKNARDGHWNGGRTPFGYKRAPSPKHPKRQILTPEPAEAWLVRTIYQWRQEGLGLRQITLRLNEAGHQHRGRNWHVSAVHSLLRNPAMAGFVVFNRRDRYVAGGQRPESEWTRVASHTPIIPVDEWEQIQEQMAAEAPGPATGSSMSSWLFTGIARCGRCGSNMVIETAKGRSKRYAYYNCGNWLSTRQCGQQRRSAEEMDKFLLQSIMTRVFTRETLQEVAQQLNAECGKRAQERIHTGKALRREIQDLDGRRRRLLEVLELQGRDAPNLGDIAERLQELNRQIRAKTERAQEIEGEKDPTYAADDVFVSELRDSILELVNDPNQVKRARTMLGRLVEGVVIHSESAEIVYHTQFLGEMNRQGVAVHSSVKWLRDQDSNLGPSD